jgi:thioredoxin reductase (NADPH)
VAELTGRGVFYGSAATEAPACAGQDVFIVGGANSAGQAAVFFSRHAASVTMLVRGDRLESSMSTYLIKQIEAIDNIAVCASAEVTEVCGDGHLERIVFTNRRNGKSVTRNAGSMFVFIGAAPRTDWLDGVVLRDERGFVRTGPDLVVEGKRPSGWPLDRDPYHLESSVPGVFVAGDVRAESVKRVASAVGEGAMAVTLVHRYLAEQ